MKKGEKNNGVHETFVAGAGKKTALSSSFSFFGVLFFFFSKHTRTNEGMDEGMNRWESERADWIELHWIRV